MIPLFPKNGSVLKIITYTQKEKGAISIPLPRFLRRQKGKCNVATDTPDQDSGDSSSAITAAASCLGNLREETHLHRASSIAVLISSLLYHEALDIQKLSISLKLICQESKLKKKDFYAICQRTFIS